VAASGSFGQVEVSTTHRQPAGRSRPRQARSDVEAAQPSEPRIGEIFRRARRHRGWSLRDVERRTGILNPHLSQIERGQIRRPDVEILWTLSELYSLDFPNIAVWSGHLDQYSTEPSASLALIALRALSRLDADAQVEALHHIEQLARESRSERP
jgi:transcriptional regulator with XRE-family HTH domain